jgi:hypothetical protein
MSRNAKMRPATAPAGSCISASDSESQTSSPPRMIDTRRFVPPDSDSSSRRTTSNGVWPTASDAGTPVMRSAAAFQSTTRRSRSTATIPSATFERMAMLCSCSSASRW